MYQNNFLMGQQPQFQAQQQPQIVTGIVSSIDEIKGAVLPYNGFGVYSTPDNSTLFLKRWKQDGTTEIVSYSPIDSPKREDILGDILNALSEINGKL